MPHDPLPFLPPLPAARMQMVSGLIHLRLMASASTPDAAQEQHLKARQILCKALKVGPVISAWGPVWWSGGGCLGNST